MLLARLPQLSLLPTYWRVTSCPVPTPEATSSSSKGQKVAGNRCMNSPTVPAVLVVACPPPGTANPCRCEQLNISICSASSISSVFKWVDVQSLLFREQRLHVRVTLAGVLVRVNIAGNPDTSADTKAQTHCFSGSQSSSSLVCK